MGVDPAHRNLGLGNLINEIAMSYSAHHLKCHYMVAWTTAPETVHMVKKNPKMAEIVF